MTESAQPFRFPDRDDLASELFIAAREAREARASRTDAEIALSDLAEVPIAVTPATYVTKVDPQEIGRTIAGWDSTAQAAFLTGLAEGFTGIGPGYGLQLTYVGMDLAKMPEQASTRYFIEVLASYLKEA